MVVVVFRRAVAVDIPPHGQNVVHVIAVDIRGLGVAEFVLLLENAPVIVEVAGFNGAAADPLRVDNAGDPPPESIVGVAVDLPGALVGKLDHLVVVIVKDLRGPVRAGGWLRQRSPTGSG